MSKRLFIWIGLFILAAVISAAGWSAYITFNRPVAEPHPQTVRGKIPQMPATPSSGKAHKIGERPSVTPQPESEARQEAAPGLDSQTQNQDTQEPSGLPTADQSPSTDAGPAGQADPAIESQDNEDKPSESGTVASSKSEPENQADQTKPVTESEPEQTTAQQTTTEASSMPSDAKAAPAAKEDQQPALKPQSVKRYTIQVGAYRNKEYAENSVARLMRKGYDAYIFEYTDAKARAWYYVRFGQFENHKKARSSLTAYQNKEQKKAIIAHSGVR